MHVRGLLAIGGAMLTGCGPASKVVVDGVTYTAPADLEQACLRLLPTGERAIQASDEPAIARSEACLKHGEDFGVDLDITRGFEQYAHMYREAAWALGAQLATDRAAMCNHVMLAMASGGNSVISFKSAKAVGDEAARTQMVDEVTHRVQDLMQAFSDTGCFEAVKSQP